jgi:uncharacterized protein YcbX
VDITGINLYPVKSMRGTALTESKVCRYGLEHDRQWMLVDADSRMITQRECPRLALFVPHVEDGLLRVEVPNATDIEVPDGGGWTSQQVAVHVFGHQYVGDVAIECINTAFSDATGKNCRLLRARSDVFRTQTEVAFHDTAPILIISQASLEELNQRLPAPLPMNRFRPTFVVEGPEHFEEDSWQRIAIGDTEFHAVKQCERCVITTVEQAEGEFRGPEPLKTLATFRRKGQNVAFGSYFRPENWGATLRVGDEVRVLQAAPLSGSASGS